MKSSSCSVRPAGPDDLEAVLAIHAEHRDQTSTPPPPSERERATWIGMSDTPNLTVYLAEISGQPVGTATAIMMPNVTYECAPTCFVEAVVVIPRYRRQGIATMIMRRVLDDARTAGGNKVQLLSHKRHAVDGAHRLYTSLGFEAEAEGFRLYLGEVPAAVRAAASH